MLLEPIKQELLEKQLGILMERYPHTLDSRSVGDIAFPLARFAEAHAINEGNRQIEAMEKKLPKPITVAPNTTLHSGDEWRVHFKLHSSHFDYFLWCLEPGTSGQVVSNLADEATRAVQAILASHQQKEE